MTTKLEELLENPNPKIDYGVGLFVACVIARYFGIKNFWALEFGVAEGRGLRALRENASVLSKSFDLNIRVAGLDLGTGLPAPEGVEDHPEIWSAGDFQMVNKEALAEEFGDDLIFGPIAETAPQLTSRLSSEWPLGFISLDVDFYSSTRDAIDPIGKFASELMLPVVSVYFDDLYGGPNRIGSLLRCPKAGQMLAIDEFNQKFSKRCIAPTYPLLERCPVDRFRWVKKLYSLHVLDHDQRSVEFRKNATTMDEFAALDDHIW